jgi:hypothetical protein
VFTQIKLSLNSNKNHKLTKTKRIASTMVMEDIMTNENNNDNILIIEAGDRPELYPHVVLKGNSANLSALRGTDAQTRSIFFDERNNNSNNNDEDEDTPSSSSPPLLMESSVFVSLMTTNADEDDENENENENNNNNNTVKGEMFITNTQILFVAIERDQSQYDLAIGAACIVLHAMTEEPELSIYLQLSSSSSAGEQQQQQQHQPPTEVTLTPSHNENDHDCQKIFDALCKLISLNPIEPDDDDDGGGSGGGGGGNMMDGMFGFGTGAGVGGFDDDNNDNGDVDDDGFIWAPTTASSNNKTSDEERDAMLERLDNLLVVPPQFEDGQFDDAIEENDD